MKRSKLVTNNPVELSERQQSRTHGVICKRSEIQRKRATRLHGLLHQQKLQINRIKWFQRSRFHSNVTKTLRVQFIEWRDFNEADFLYQFYEYERKQSIFHSYLPFQRNKHSARPSFINRMKRFQRSRFSLPITNHRDQFLEGAIACQT